MKKFINNIDNTGTDPYLMELLVKKEDMEIWFDKNNNYIYMRYNKKMGSCRLIMAQ